VDEIADTEAWKAEFLKPEAGEVVQALGAWLYCFELPHDGSKDGEVESVLKAIAEVQEQHSGNDVDSLLLAVCLPPPSQDSALKDKDKIEKWEGVCFDHGFELICYGSEGTNEFGEKVGFERLKEALEANEWAAGDNDDLGVEDLDFDLEDDMDVAGREEAEWTSEFVGVKAALARDDSELMDEEDEEAGQGNIRAEQVEHLDRIMGTLLAVKEQGADLPETERKRMAAKAVRDVMESA
jgi:alpha- and gamma-adaptin-binding protein p34